MLNCTQAFTDNKYLKIAELTEFTLKFLSETVVNYLTYFNTFPLQNNEKETFALWYNWLRNTFYSDNLVFSKCYELKTSFKKKPLHLK